MRRSLQNLSKPRFVSLGAKAVPNDHDRLGAGNRATDIRLAYQAELLRSTSNFRIGLVGLQTERYPVMVWPVQFAVARVPDEPAVQKLLGRAANLEVFDDESYLARCRRHQPLQN